MKTISIAFFFFLAVAEGIALVTAGTEDFGAFLFWTIPAAAISALLGNLLVRSTGSIGRISGIILSFILGGIFGVLWLYLVALFLGPWIGAFGIPIILCWIAGGATSFVGCRLLSYLPPVKALPVIVAIALGSSAGVFVIPLVAKWFGNDQKLLTFVFRYTAGDDELKIEENDPNIWNQDVRLTQEEKKVLKAKYPKGELQIETRGSNGTGAESKAIIVIERPVVGEVKLAQPNKDIVFYFQTEAGFELRPVGSPTLNRFIKLKSRGYSADGTAYVAIGYLIDSWDGSATGSDIMRWAKRDGKLIIPEKR